MATVINGTPINFSFQSAAGITITGLTGGILLQKATQKKVTKRTLIHDGNGDRCTSVHNDAYTSATITYLPSGTGIANAIANSVLTSPGGSIKITACDSIPGLVSALYYEIITAELSGSNDDAKTIVYEIELSAIQTFPATA